MENEKKEKPPVEKKEKPPVEKIEVPVKPITKDDFKEVLSDFFGDDFKQEKEEKEKVEGKEKEEKIPKINPPITNEEIKEKDDIVVEQKSGGFLDFLKKIW